MSTFNYDRRSFFNSGRETGVFTAPSLLSEGAGTSYLPSFVGTAVDRSIYGSTEGGAGRWLFGAFRTPQRWVTDWSQGWDPDVATKIDPTWNAERAKSIAGSIPQSSYAAIMYVGGEELKNDIIENSVSSAHFAQRISEIETIAKAKMAIDKYDAESNFLTYGIHKTLSAGVNYVFSDPMTAISIIATAGLAAPAAAGVAAARTASIGTRIAQLSENYSRTWRAATYLWDGLDGASSAYSSWDQLNSDGYRIYGETFKADTNWTDDVAFGAGMGLGFSMGGDVLGRMFKKADATSPVNISSIENMAANSVEGTLSTAIDHVSLSAWRTSKSRLERAIDTITGPDTELRRTLMDDDARQNAHWGTREDMDELSDWIEKNKPDAAELSEHVSDRLKAAELNRQKVEGWSNEVDDYVLAGGDQRHFFRKKAADLLRTHMGDDFGSYRFILDYLEEASGDARLVAEWMARGDKDRVVRVANAITANRRIGVLEDTAVKNALERVRQQGQLAAADEAQQAMNRVHDNLVQGRFMGAVDILNEMHLELATRNGRLVEKINASIDRLNEAYSSLNAQAFDRLEHFKEMEATLIRLRKAAEDSQASLTSSKNKLSGTMSPDADNAAVMAASSASDVVPAKTSSADSIAEELKEAVAKFMKAEEAVTESLDAVGKKKRTLLRKTGKEGLDRTMEEVNTFPLWKFGVTESGYQAVRRSALRQTQAANRWKVEFVDRFLGESSADNALKSGTNPLRPVLRERAPIQRMSVADQDRVLTEELSAVAPEIASIKAGAADVSLDAKLANLREVSQQLRKSVDTAKAMLERRANKDDAISKKMSDIIKKRERTLKRTDSLIDRMDKQLQGQVDVLNKDLEVMETATADTVRAARVAEKVAAHTEAAKKLRGVDPLTKKGRNLRDKVRTAAADMTGGTRFSSLTRESEMVTAELGTARADLDRLVKNGATDSDPRVKALRDEVEYLDKRANAIKGDIDKINGRPAMIRRSHALQGNNPPIDDIVAISRLRASIASAVNSGNKDLAEELNRRLYNLYGDSTRLPKWQELEDFFIKQESSVADGKAAEELMTVATDGRTVKFSVAESTVVDAATGESTSTVKYMTSNAVDGSKTGGPVTTATGSNPKPSAKKTSGGKDKPLTDAEKARKDKQDKILGALSPAESPGERLVITNNILMNMGRIPMLRNLGRAVLRLQTAGTGFGAIHNSSRALDLVVTAFNMLDRPEALVRSLGFNNGSIRTLQNFRDQGRIAVNELAVAEQRARRAGHYTGTLDQNRLIQDALDSGDTTALNAGQREMYDVMRRHYDEAGRRLAITNGEGVVRPNYRPREANTSMILARMQEAQTSFRNVYADRIRTAGEPLPDELADQLGVPRGTAFNALNDADRAAFDAAVDQYANRMANQTVARLTHGVTEDGVGYRIATGGPDSTAARTLEDAVYADPRVRQWYLNSPVQEHKLYMEMRSPQIMFDAQLSEAIGVNASFDDVIDALRQHILTIADPTVANEFGLAVTRLERKWRYHTGRAQYAHNEFLDPAFRTSTGIVRGSFGSFWGLAGLVTEVPRAVAAARMYGGGMRGMFDLLHAIRNSGDMASIQDIAHATDQYASHAHSSFGSSIGTSFTERILAPWERVWHTITGEEVLTNGGTAMGRVSSTVVAAAEAYGETGMRLGGMQYFSGIARIVADRQAKRFIARNIDNMERLANALQGIGAVAENTAASRAAFRQAAEDAGIPYDVALQMNHNGLLTPDVVASLRNGLTGQDEVWNMGMMRGRVDDRTMGAVMDFLTAAHNYHVPTASLASSVEAGNVFGKLFYNLTSYSRAFALNVAFRTAANGRFATMMGTFGAVMVGENLYQAMRETALGKTRVEDLEEEWNENPAAFFMKRAVKSPWLGAHNGAAHSVVEMMSGGGSAAAMRGNNAIGPIIQSGNLLLKNIFSNEKTGERDFRFLNTHLPIYNTWYSRMMLGGEE